MTPTDVLCARCKEHHTVFDRPQGAWFLCSGYDVIDGQVVEKWPGTDQRAMAYIAFWTGSAWVPGRWTKEGTVAA